MLNTIIVNRHQRNNTALAVLSAARTSLPLVVFILAVKRG